MNIYTINNTVNGKLTNDGNFIASDDGKTYFLVVNYFDKNDTKYIPIIPLMREGDIVYQNENDWLLVDKFPMLIAQNEIMELSKNKDNPELKEAYQNALNVLKEYPKNPKLLTKEETEEFLEIREENMKNL